VKIIHLSDTHVGYGGNEMLLRKIVEDLTKSRPCDTKQHLLIHTGDLVDDAANPSASKAARALLEELREFGYGVLLCPGNHDYGDSMSMTRQHADDFRSAFGDFFYLQGDTCAMGARALANGTGDIFPVVHIIADIALIGLDSCWAEMNWLDRFFAEGKLGVEQLLDLNMLLDRPELAGKKIIIYLHHHPFYYGYKVKPDLSEAHAWSHWLASVTRSFRRLKDAYSFNQIVRDRVHVLLFGHVHFGLDCRAESRKYGIPLAFDGSSSTCMSMDTDRMRYRIIDLDNMTSETRFIML
jgi:3',5'-cyclic AMP phosphodiesterase CpdA